jgi:ABC-type lipoprotein export system ATPase subunit
MLKEMCNSHGFTILAVTHQPLLTNSADRVYRVDNGPVLVNESPQWEDTSIPAPTSGRGEI